MTLQTLGRTAGRNLAIVGMAMSVLCWATGAAAQTTKNPSFNLINRAPSAIRELYVTPAGDANWGRNRLVAGPIAPGSGFTVRRRTDGNCIFDIRAVYADARVEERRGVNTCATADVVFDGGAARKGAAAPAAKAPGDPSFGLLNRGPSPLVELYFVPAGTGNWGENRLADATLPAGAERSFQPSRGDGCSYDLRVVFADHKALERRATDLCRVRHLTVP